MKKSLKTILSVSLAIFFIFGGLFLSSTLGNADGAQETNTVIIRFSGVTRKDKVLKVNSGSVITFNDYEIDGLTLNAYDDQMNSIDKLVVSKNQVINLVYSDGKDAKMPNNGPQTDKTARIVVIAGQSNASGVGRYNYLQDNIPSEYLNKLTTGFDNVLISEWTDLQERQEFTKVKLDPDVKQTGIAGTFGTECFIAERLSEAFPDETTYIVKVSMGGCSLDYDFHTPSAGPPISFNNEGYTLGWVYQHLVDYLSNAITEISKTGKTPVIDGLFWLQGEAEATRKECSVDYYRIFDAFVDDFTTQFDGHFSSSFAVYDATIYMGESTLWDYGESVNADKKKYALDTGNYCLDVASMGLTTICQPTIDHDYAHFDAEQYVILGHSLADMYLKHLDNTYVANKLELGNVQSNISLRVGTNQYIQVPKVYYNGEEIVDADLIIESSNINVLTVRRDGKLCPLKSGSAKVKLVAIYKGEVVSTIIPVTITK